MTAADVIAVFSTRWGQFLICVVIGGVAYLLGDAWQHRARKKPLVTTPFTAQEWRDAYATYTPQSFSLPAHKGFKTDYQHEVVDLAEWRRNRQVH